MDSYAGIPENDTDNTPAGSADEVQKSNHSAATINLSSDNVDVNGIIDWDKPVVDNPKIMGMTDPNRIYLLNSFNVTGMNFTITGLRHFTLYEIRIWACQNISVPGSDCSNKEAYLLKRTPMIEAADSINSSSVSVHNSSSDLILDSRFVKWQSPQSPNGRIVAYEIKYVRDSLVADTATIIKKECLPVSKYHRNSGGWTLHDLLPGNYSISIRALSLAQKGTWTPKMYFFVASRSGVSLVAVILISVFSILLGLLLMVLCVYVTLRRKINERFRPCAMKFMSGNPDYISALEVYQPDDWELDRHKIEVGHFVGKGSFGVVYKGLGLNVTSVCGISFGPCAVKKVLDGASIIDRYMFLNEAVIMKSFNTAHIVKLLGVVSESPPQMVVLEWMKHGSLKEYLMARRSDEENSLDLPPLSFSRVLLMVGQIADGMAYLEACRFVHRDLAARNIMMDQDETCKIGDFGMARETYYKDYYRPSGRRMMPVRWMAPEALKDATFSSKSDVWAFGVVVWEIVTLAQQPYMGLTNEQVIEAVVDGGLTLRQYLPKANNKCPDLIAEVVDNSWKHDPRDRLSFDCLLTKIILPHLNNETFERTSYYYTQRNDMLKSSEESNKSFRNDEYNNDDSTGLIQAADITSCPLQKADYTGVGSDTIAECQLCRSQDINDNRVTKFLNWLKKFNPTSPSFDKRQRNAGNNCPCTAIRKEVS